MNDDKNSVSQVATALSDSMSVENGALKRLMESALSQLKGVDDTFYNLST